jgi:excisionase family DNA binding protein
MQHCPEFPAGRIEPDKTGIYSRHPRINPNQQAAMPTKPKRKPAAHTHAARPRSPDVLDVHGTAALLTVSADTVYDLFAKGELPGRKVGRKWLTTRAAVMRWIEASATNDTLGRALESGDAEALAKAMNSGKVRVRSKGQN